MPTITKPGVFLVLLTAFIAVACLLVSLEMPDGVSGPRARVVYVWQGIEPLVVVAAVVALVIVEGWTMLAEKFLKERYQKGQEEGRKEGQTQERQVWLAWNERRTQAQEAGRGFDEPPPAAPEAK